MMTRVLAAGDRFIRAELFRESLRRAVGPHLEIRELEFPWPDEPFGAIGEVEEASGTEEELIESLEGVTAIVTQLAPLTEHVLNSSPDLRMIAVSRGGPTNVNLRAAHELGIRVANVPGRNGVATAEMTIGLVLALLRRIPLAHSSLLAGHWRGDLYRWNAVGTEAAASVIGLLGAGAVGMHVAKVFDAMGADVLVYDPYLPAEALNGVARRAASLDELFEQSDLISIHARLTAETNHIVNRERLRQMRPGTMLVNAARGGLVDYDAVTEALENGHLRGVAFDVFPEEPVDFDHKLFQLAHEGHDLVLTPHIAGASLQTAQRAAEGTAEEVRRFIAGLSALNPLNDADIPETTPRTAR